VSGLPLVFADDALVVLNKPAGLLAVPGKTSNDCLSLQVQAVYPDARVVHRLDMATSGLMVMARGAEAQRVLNAHFAERRVYKRYLAWVGGDCRARLPVQAGPLPSDWQGIDMPIAVDWPQRPLRKIDPAGKPSSTRWRCLRYDPLQQRSLLELEPLTGRSHQLRVHLQALGHPILGDALYAPAALAAACPRLLLHAWALGFSHPTLGTWMAFEQPDGLAAWA